jgi:NAD(P)H-flavin reductase
MLVKKYLAEIISISNPFVGIYTLECKSLSGYFKYSPGQFLHLAMDEEYDGTGQWPESRCFSMQSNPDAELIKITYSVKGNFTKLMENSLKSGSKVWLKLPYGDLFSQEHNKINTVFIAGGTGITPFLSLFTHDSFNNYIYPKIYLGFRSTEFNIYQNELRNVKSKSISIFYENQNGKLNIREIFEENGPSSSYFISGPPSMIRMFRGFLLDAGVLAINILTDDWE